MRKRQCVRRDLGDCAEDELNVEVLEDVHQELGRKSIQTKSRAIIHFHHWLRCSESLKISEHHIVFVEKKPVNQKYL